jgi:hypothetical protein
MKKITMTLLAVMILFTAAAQEDFRRRGTHVPKTETAPALNAIKDAGVYTGDGYEISRWNAFEGSGGTVAKAPTPIEGAIGKFWFAYDDENLYVFTEVTTPPAVTSVELGVTVHIDVMEHNYGWQADPLGEDGFVFSKAVFGTDLQPDEIKKLRLFDYIYTPTAEGYEAEVRIKWADLTTNAALVTAFKERGVFHFDIGYKFNNADSTNVGWSNNNNRSFRETFKAGVVNFELVRKSTSISQTSTAPVMNAVKDAAVYTGNGFAVENWTTRNGSVPMMPYPFEGVSSNFWMTYDDENLYVFGEISVSEVITTTELGIMVSIEANDADFGWQADPLGEDGFVFSKAVFGTDLQPDEIKTLRLFDYIYATTPDGYEYEVRIPWAGLTTDAAKLTAFKERKTFFFDLGYKLNNKDSVYFAWSNNNNRIWRESFPAGVVSFMNTSTSDIQTTSLNVYPNPARNLLYIGTESQARFAEVYNLTGARVLVAGLESGSIDISSLREGIYIVRIQYENGQSAVRKFAKTNN